MKYKPAIFWSVYTIDNQLWTFESLNDAKLNHHSVVLPFPGSGPKVVNFPYLVRTELLAPLGWMITVIPSWKPNLFHTQYIKQAWSRCVSEEFNFIQNLCPSYLKVYCKQSCCFCAQLWREPFLVQWLFYQ